MSDKQYPKSNRKINGAQQSSESFPQKFISSVYFDITE